MGYGMVTKKNGRIVPECILDKGIVTIQGHPSA